MSYKFTHLKSRLLKERLWKVLNMIVAVATISQLSLASVWLSPLVARAAPAANPSADLDQCANDPAPSPSTNGCSGAAGENGWVNGNLNASKSVYFENDSVPYRMRFDNLSLGSHTVIIEWDTTKSGKHALDYLTTFNRTVADADPCLGVTGCGSATTFPIPVDTQVSGGGVTQIPGNFTMYNGTITGVGSGYSYPDGTGFTGDKSARIAITFTASNATPVLAWGGHISDRHDWGADNSAVAIPGSPYHMRLIELDGKGGNQDRSLSADAVIFPGSITIVKQATPEGSTSFPFTASPSPLSNFSLVDDGTSANTKLFSNIIDFKTYAVAETVPSNWTLNSINCSVTSPNGGSQNVSQPSVSINLKEGENVSCTFNNERQAGQVTFEKIVSGGDADPSEWTFTVDGVAGSFQTGDSTTLPTGTYTVHESGPAGYSSQSVSGICSNLNGNSATLTVTQSGGTCTFTNSRDTGSLTVKKNVDTDGDGQVDDFNVATWTWNIAAGEQNIDTGQSRPLVTGVYTVSENQKTNYHVVDLTCDGQSQGAVESGQVTVTKGGNHVCTFTNARDTGAVQVNKLADADGNGTFETSNPGSFTWTLDGGSTQMIMGSTLSPVITGSHSVNENSVPDYHFVGWFTTGSTQYSCSNPEGTTLPISVNVSKDTTTSITLCNARDTGTITGHKFEDLDGDGVLDAGEPGVFGVAIHLSNGWDTTTDASGDYQFSNVPTGTYSVSETVPAGWVATTPTQYNNIVVTKNQTTTVDPFGNFKLIEVRVCKYVDTRGDGSLILDPLYVEAGGWGMTLDTAAQNTDAGCTTFTNIGPGQHSLTEEAKTGWTQTVPSSGGYNFTAYSGLNEEFSFGNFENVSVEACKVEDADGNPQTTNDQTLVENWPMYLLVNGQVSGPVKYTSQNGCTSWTDLGPGVSYGVKEGDVAGWTHLDNTTHDFDPAVSGAEYTHTFANFENVTISGHKYEDINGDGAAGPNTPLGGWVIHLKDGNGNVIDSDITDAQGYYEFLNLVPGTYNLEELVPVGWTPTEPTNGKLGPITVESGHTYSDNNFYNFKNVSVTVCKKVDLNNDSIILNDPFYTEAGGWQVSLDQNDQNTDGGCWTFYDVGPGQHTVSEEVKTGWVQTVPGNNGTYGFAAASGQPETFTFGNFEIPHLTVIKHVITDNGGTAVAGQFTMVVSANNPSQSEFPGDENGVTISLDAGAYNVTEKNGPPGYLQTNTDPNCSGIVQSGDHPTCTIVNDDILATLNIEKTDAPDPVQAGGVITYTIEWSLTGEGFADNLVISDSIPSLTAYVVNSADCGQLTDNPTTGQCDINDSGDPLEWSIGTRAAGDSGKVTFQVTVDSPLPDGTEIENTACIDRVDVENDGQSESLEVESEICYTTTTEVDSDFDVTIVKTDNTDPVSAGGQIVYTLDWTVSGNTPIDSLIITDPLPSNTTFVAASLGGVHDGNTPGQVTWDLGAVPSGNDSDSVTVTVQVASPIVSGTELTNQAEICGQAITLPHEEMVEKCDDDPEITTVESAPILSIVKTNSVSGFTNPGKNVTYTLVVTNAANATDTARNVKVTDVLPDGFIFQSSIPTEDSVVGQIVTWSLGDLAPDKSATIEYVVTIAAHQSAGTYPNTATAKADNHGPVSDTSDVVVRLPQVLGATPEIDLSLVKTVDPKVTNPGKVVTYTLTIINSGDVDATNLSVTDTLPSGFTFIEGGLSTKTFVIGTLPANHTRVINYEVRVGNGVKAGTYRNTAVLTADGIEPQKAQAEVEVRVPRVLAATGVSLRDYLIFAFGLTALAFGLVGLRRRNHGDSHS